MMVLSKETTPPLPLPSIASPVFNGVTLKSLWTRLCVLAVSWLERIKTPTRKATVLSISGAGILETYCGTYIVSRLPSMELRSNIISLWCKKWILKQDKCAKNSFCPFVFFFFLRWKYRIGRNTGSGDSFSREIKKSKPSFLNNFVVAYIT